MLPYLFLALASAADPELELSVEIRPEELKAHVQRLADPQLLGRRAEGATRTAEHLATAFAQMKLKPAFGESYFQPIPWLLTTPAADGKKVTGRNVGGFIPGSDPKLADEWIILSAHYDHLGTNGSLVFPGADDNASGVAMLLEVAEAFALGGHKPARSVYFISFDLEEFALQGATHFAAHPPRDFGMLRAFLTADLLGRSFGDCMDEHLFVLGSETSPELRGQISRTKPEAGLTVGRLGADIVGTRSDYGPFRDRRVPFLFFTTGTHRDYHQPTDLPDRLNYEKLAKISRWIAKVTERLAGDAAPQWKPNAEPDLAEAQSLLAMTRQVLAKSKKTALSADKQKRLESARDRLIEIDSRGSVTPEERVWIVETARWALVNLF